MLGYGLTEQVDARVVTGFELVARTWPLRATPPVDECSVVHCLLPNVSYWKEGRKWALSICLSIYVLCTNRRAEEVKCNQYWYTDCRIVCCCYCEYRHTDYWYMYSMVMLTIWQPAVKICHGQFQSWCAICAVVTKKVSDTKNDLFWQLWEEEEQDQGCLKEHRGTLLVSQTRVVVSRHWLWYKRRWASFESQCSISWDEMSMIWIDVSFDSSRAVLQHW